MQVYKPSESVNAVDEELTLPGVVDAMSDDDDYEGMEPSVVALNAIEREEFDALVAIENSPTGMLGKLVMFAQRLLRRFADEKFGYEDPELAEWAAISRTIAMRHMQRLTEFEVAQYRDCVATVGTTILLTQLDTKVNQLVARITQGGETISAKDRDFCECNSLLHEIGGHYLGSFDAAQCYRFNTVMGQLVLAMGGPMKPFGDTVRDEEDDALEL